MSKLPVVSLVEKRLRELNLDEFAIDVQLERFFKWLELTPEQVENMQEASNKLEIWLAHFKDMPEEVSQQAVIKVEVTRHYGSQSVTVGFEKSYILEYPAQRRVAVENLIRACNAEHDEYMRKGGAIHRPASGSTGGEWRDIIAIRKENEKGVDRWKVTIAGFEKFGVPLYKEVQDKHDLSWEYFNYGDTPFAGQVQVDFVDGKPKRVLAIKAN